MTAQPPSDRRAQKQGNHFLKKRTFQGALGGIIGAVAMSVIAGILVTAAVTPVVAVTGTTAATAIGIFDSLPEHLDPGKLAKPSTLYAKDSEGNAVPIASFYDQDRQEVGWDQISQYVKDAVVATEDPRFYTHGGVDFLATVRAAVQNVVGQNESGASTVTMQYVRNVLIQEAEAKIDETEREEAYEKANARDADRKLKEMRYAIAIEKKYSKDEIMLGYLNIALFGRQVYGIESAANYYYGVSAKDLTIAQSASLVAIVNNPSVLQIDIEENIPANLERRNRIIGDMFNRGKITEAQYEQAINEELVPNITPKVSGCEAAGDLGHFCNYVKLTIQNDPSFGNTEEERLWNFRRGGYEIMTTIDLDMQAAGAEAIRSTVPELMDGIDVGAASVSTEVGTGKVLAMVQNRPYSQAESRLAENPGLTGINYNTEYQYGGSSGFQVASTFKAITLAEYIRAGYSVRDIVNVNGRTVQMQNFRDTCKPEGVAGAGSWTFSNDNEGTRGQQSVLTATANSVNGGFISMVQKMDVCDVMKLAASLNITQASGAPLEGNLASTFAGTDPIAPITMANAYAAFAGDGTVCTSTPIESIKDSDGADVPFTGSTCKQGIEPRVAAGVAYALEYTVTNGLARHAGSPFGVPHLAKTGTSDDVVDNWTVGASTKVATATWVGNVSGKVSTKYFGRLMYADQTIWPAIMNVADQKYGGDRFPEPDSNAMRVSTVTVPDTAGKSVEDATALLTGVGFTVVEGSTVDSAKPKDSVANTEPAGGTNAQAGSVITLNISNGSMKEVPEDLVDRTSREARTALASAGFGKVDQQCEGGGSVPRDSAGLTVVGVSPGSGSEAKTSNQITLQLKCD